MSDPVVRRLEPGDLDDALALSSASGWNQTAADWRMLRDLAPAGCFAAVLDERVVATAIGIDYGRFGWIAMMLVAPEYRGRGLGRRLLESAVAAVPADRPIRLDATPMGRPLYLRYGFRDEHSLTRYVRDAMNGGDDDHFPDVRPLTRDDLRSVVEHDVAAFRGVRAPLLEWTFARAPQYARIMHSSAGGPEYCLGRRGRLFDHIGPIVAATAGHACALAGSAMPAAEGRAIAVDSFDAHSGFTGWLVGRGFRTERPLLRMCRPVAGQDWTGDAGRSPLTEFAILGPEFA